MKTKYKFPALVLSLIFIVGCFTSCLSSVMKDYIQTFNDGGLETFANSLVPLTEEEVEWLAPKNHQQANYIDNLPRHPDTENWVVFMYVCGSNLESQGNYSISSTLEIEKLLDQYNRMQTEEQGLSSNLQHFQDFTQVQKDNNLSLPETFYEKQPIFIPSEVEEEESLLDTLGAKYRGVASTDLMHITNVKLPENITFIIQTGGTYHWDYPGVNPNLTQRWKYDHTGLSEIYSGPAENMGSPDGLTNFLEFSKSYHSDHNAFIFWNHGGGAFGAQLGKAIIDTFMEKASQYTYLMGDTLITNQLGLLDLSKTKDIYEAYGQLINKALKDSLTNPAVLTQFATASQKSIRYAGDYYNIYNTCDLGLFMDGIADAYPEAKQIRAMIDESLLYQRGIGQNAFSTGLSIYFPTEVTEPIALLKALEYIEEISTEPAVKAFYYYKLAGCLSEEHQEYVESQGWGRAPVINTAPLKEISSTPMEVHPDLEKGDQLTPLYRSTTGLWADEVLVEGEKIKFDPEKITMGEIPLKDGVYIQCIQLQDFRGNIFISPLLSSRWRKAK